MSGQQQSPADMAVEYLGQVSTKAQRLAESDFTTKATTAGTRSTVAEYQTRTPIAVKDGKTYDVDLVAYESFTSDGTAGNSETFNLSHDVIDAPAFPVNVVLYEGSSSLAVGSVDYANDTVTASPANANSTIHAFYVCGDQATLDVRKKAPNGTHEEIASVDVGLANQRDQNRTPFKFSFDHPLEGVIPKDWKLIISVDGPYRIVWSEAGGSAVPTQQLLSIPIQRAETELPQWVVDVIAQVAATQ